MPTMSGILSTNETFSSFFGIVMFITGIQRYCMHEALKQIFPILLTKLPWSLWSESTDIKCSSTRQHAMI